MKKAVLKVKYEYEDGTTMIDTEGLDKLPTQVKQMIVSHLMSDITNLYVGFKK